MRLGAGAKNREAQARLNMQHQRPQQQHRPLSPVQHRGGLRKRVPVGIGQDQNIQPAPTGQRKIAKGRARPIAQLAHPPIRQRLPRMQDHVTFDTAR